MLAISKRSEVFLPPFSFTSVGGGTKAPPYGLMGRYFVSCKLFDKSKFEVGICGVKGKLCVALFKLGKIIFGAVGVDGGITSALSD